MDIATTKTFEQLAADPEGTVYKEGYSNDIRYIILRGTSALCAYVGIPKKHPLAGHHYNNFCLPVHGGLIFGGEGKGDFLPEDYFWYGWDYGHCNDMSFYNLTSPDYALNGKKWTVKDVDNEIWEATYNFKRLCDLAESIYMKVKGWR